MRIRVGVLALVLLICGSVLADTGGSMGGGDWSSSGGGGGYSSSSSSSSSSSYSYSSDSSSYSSSNGSSGNLGGFEIIVLLVILVGWGLVSAIQKSSGDIDYSALHNPGNYVPSDTVDVSVLRVVIDGRARKFVQTELARIAKQADTRTADGRLAMLREVSLMLRRIRDAWVYGGAVNEPMRGISAAKPVFDKHVDDARLRFRTETVRNAQGVVTTAQPGEYTPRSDEGEGVILVSIVVCARSELFTVRNIGDGEHLRLALEAAAHRAASDLVAIEIVWQPSEDSDRLSSIELEAKYPRPELIPITNALVGKVFCEYCGGPFPAELVSCPHCGAPAKRVA